MSLFSQLEPIRMGDYGPHHNQCQAVAQYLRSVRTHKATASFSSSAWRCSGIALSHAITSGSHENSFAATWPGSVKPRGENRSFLLNASISISLHRRVSADQNLHGSPPDKARASSIRRSLVRMFTKHAEYVAWPELVIFRLPRLLLMALGARSYLAMRSLTILFVLPGTTSSLVSLSYISMKFHDPGEFAEEILHCLWITSRLTSYVGSSSFVCLRSRFGNAQSRSGYDHLAPCRWLRTGHRTAYSAQRLVRGSDRVQISLDYTRLCNSTFQRGISSNAWASLKEEMIHDLFDVHMKFKIQNI
ncbi:hypothetical protein VNO77_02983 [Canavalia gladiata]|uniref:Uncharacterized protein n=1 Tax=Canavalia gladiata TaxID=3824 RepID=A0AAN9R6E7_CANGL